MKSLTSNKEILGYHLMDEYPNIFCFTTTRHNGYSSGNYDSFNCSPFCNDDELKVLQNQQKLLSLLPKGARLIIPHQVHQDKIQIVNTGNEDLDGFDALITNHPNLCLCISTADCVPLLLYDKENKVIAAIHAGWRSTVLRIVEKTIALMKDKYQTNPKELIATIGPSISMKAFEVGNEVYQAFENEGFEMNDIAKKNQTTGKYHIDLWKANKIQLLSSGILDNHIEISNICTYSQHQDFFSARRLGINSGRLLTGIILTANK